MYLQHTSVLTSFKCTYSVQVYLQCSSVHTTYRFTYSVKVYLLRSSVLTAYKCIYSIQVYLQRTSVRIRSLESESGVGVRSRSQESESGVEVRSRTQKSESGVRVRRRSHAPESENDRKWQKMTESDSCHYTAVRITMACNHHFLARQSWALKWNTYAYCDCDWLHYITIRKLGLGVPASEH